MDAALSSLLSGKDHQAAGPEPEGQVEQKRADDRPGIRSDATNITLSGDINANLSNALFSTNGTGSFNLTGQITGKKVP